MLLVIEPSIVVGNLLAAKPQLGDHQSPTHFQKATITISDGYLVLISINSRRRTLAPGERGNHVNLYPRQSHQRHGPESLGCMLKFP